MTDSDIGKNVSNLSQLAINCRVVRAGASSTRLRYLGGGRIAAAIVRADTSLVVIVGRLGEGRLTMTKLAGGDKAD